MRFSGSINEGEIAATTNAVSAPGKVASVSAFPAMEAAAAPVAGEKRISKWNAKKKINRIYADWLDDLTPPHLSPEDRN